MAEDKLLYCRSESMWATRSESVKCFACAISLRAPQNSFSRLTLVRWPAMTIECFTTADSMALLTGGNAPQLACLSEKQETEQTLDQPNVLQFGGVKTRRRRNTRCTSAFRPPPAQNFSHCCNSPLRSIRNPAG